MPKKGSKRKKTRTHVKPTDSSTDPNAIRTPKSFVVKSGVVGGTVAALTKDVRQVLEPNTGSRISERKSNRLRDFVSMSGPLGVTHLLVFSQPSSSSHIALPSTKSDKKSSKSSAEEASARAEKSLIEGTTTLNLRLIRLPRGPTLSFKVLRYSLASDVLRMARRPRSVGREFAEAPMLILAGFGGADKQLQLMTTVFQNLFPAIHVQTMALSSARRVVLLSYSPQTRTIDFRHYLISVRPVGVSKPIRKIVLGSALNRAGKRSRSASAGAESSDDEGYAAGGTTGGLGVKGKGVLDLSRAKDISDYILAHEGLGFLTSDSEQSSDGGGSAHSGSEASGSEEDEKRGKVRLAADYVGRGNRGRGVKGEKRAVRLVELGPRMELGLVKVEEGVGEGEVLFHEIVHKSVSEATRLAKVHAAKRKLAAERKAAQALNVAAKKAAKKAASGEKGDDDEDEDEDEDKIDSDNSFDYDEQHGLVDEDDEEEEEDGEGEGDEEEFDEVSDDEGLQNEIDEAGEQMALDSDAEDSDSENERANEEDDDDSDMSPIPFHASDSESDAPPPKKPKQTNRPSAGPMSFKHKGFQKQERAPPKGAIGIQLPRMEKKPKEGEGDDGGRAGRGRGGSKGSFSKRGGFEGRGGARGGRGGGERGRGGGRGGRGGGDRGRSGRGGRGRGRD